MAALVALLGGCDSSEVERIHISAHYVPGCAPADDEAPTQLELVALGDFDRSNYSVSILRSDAEARALPLPSGTRAVELSTLGADAYWGSGTLRENGDMPVVLWPRDRSCRLGAALTGDAADSGEPWLLGVSREGDQLLALAPWRAGDVSPFGVSVDLGDGATRAIAREAGAPLARRGASLSALGDVLVVAGGVEATSGAALASADVFDPALGRFHERRLVLDVARTRHAAVSTPDATVLIGGEDATGGALDSLELLVAGSDRSHGVLRLLRDARIEPSAVLLDDARVLVAGGYARAGDERVHVESLEVLSLDLGVPGPPPLTLEPAAVGRAIVALGYGGALAVGGCTLALDAAECTPCRAAPGCVTRDVWWIDAGGSAHQVEPLPPELAVERPRLVPGGRSAPWLFADGRLGRFDPWRARFELVGSDGLAPLAPLAGTPVALGPRAFAWLSHADDGVHLAGLYHTQRGPYSQDVAPLLSSGPEELVPARPPTAESDSGEASDPPLVLRHGARDGLELAGSAAVVGIAETHYADFALELEIGAGPPPLVRLIAPRGSPGTGISLGGLDCPWPDGDELAPGRLALTRRGSTVSLERLADGATPTVEDSTPGRAVRRCERALPERVRVELVGTPAGTSRVTRLQIRRSL